MLEPIVSSLKNVIDFLNLKLHHDSIAGYIDDLEMYALHRIAMHGPGHGAIVEIGSFLGRSTVVLAAASKSVGREKVVAIDHFRGSPEHQPGQSHASEVLANEGTTFHEFQRNLQRFQVDDYVVPIAARSADAAAKWIGPIRFLFIDGDHSYEESRRDFEMWSPFVVPYGLIGLHDIDHWPGVTQFYRECLQSYAGYEEVLAIQSLRVLQKKPQ